MATQGKEMRKRKLPTGIQTFRLIREEGCYYVDKTPFAHRLVTEGSRYFLSRPRRFGKSLFVDTLKELFEGNEPLFRGLYIHERWDWSVRCPVLRLDFGGGDYQDPDWQAEDLIPQIEALEASAGIQARYSSARARFRYLIQTLHRQTGQRVAVLVDEYDKPILEALGAPEIAHANRLALRGLYSIIKQCDAHIRFALLTGVTKFGKVSIFSDLNNLTDITLRPDYAAICGYTDDDLDTVFAPELPGLDRQAIRDWYDGYNWRGESSVYNPYDILLFFASRELDSHWFETATPTFLVDKLRKRHVAAPDLERARATGDLLSAFDIDDMSTEALLFQSGYLTILGEERDETGALYRLGCPNREVRRSLNACLLRAMAPDGAGRDLARRRLRDLLGNNDFDGLETLFRSFFASIPYEWHTRNDIAHFEGYYASVFYSHFAGAGLDVVVEESTSHGRLDMAVRVAGNVHVFEFKKVAKESDGSAMAQLREKRYADKYRHLGEPIHLIGVEFSEADRNIAAFEVERA